MDMHLPGTPSWPLAPGEGESGPECSEKPALSTHCVILTAPTQRLPSSYSSAEQESSLCTCPQQRGDTSSLTTSFSVSLASGGTTSTLV